ncbi:UPF0481 protein [Canna indica]|uniref:UPF0481 protein n=1 Tax=Canna indica TaxID=4628 RepID=A0AAQ3JVU1_9LILI|nr:UPF0481 protein [Canna indica]
MLSLYSKATPECPLISEESIQFEYILDYCHIYFKPTLDKYNKPTQLGNKWKPTKSKSTIANRWRRATDLYEAGITFKRFKCHCRSLLDVNFENGVLEIPTLTIDLQTRTLFSNIIAFEQKLDNPNTSNNYFTAYVKFMADLVTTVDDIKLLAKKRIIEHHFRTDEDLLKLFEDLVKGVRFRVDQDNYLTQMFTRLELHYESRPKKWMADLKRKHCNTPWMIIGIYY